MSKIPPISKKLRIAFNTNAPWSFSGYGQQAAMLLPYIRNEGYATACYCFYGLEGGVIELDGIVMYPKIADTWGGDGMVEHSRYFKPDVVISLQDIWVLNPMHIRALMDDGRKWLTWLPVDHEPIPNAVLERARMAYRIISMSPFGYEELKRVGLHSTYIPHGVDTDVFKKRDKAEMKKLIKVPEDTFLFGMIAANKDNPPRKGFQHVLDCFKIFHERHPKSAIYMHVMAQQAGGFNVDEYVKNLGLTNCFYKSDPYRMLFNTGPDEIARYHAAFDCLLAPSTGEGFGIPIIEAQACETPVITSDFTAMKSIMLDGKTGYTIKKGYKRFDNLGSYAFDVDDDELLEKMEMIYAADREKMGKEARRFIMDNFDMNLVWETKWKVFFERLEKEIYPES